MSGYQWVRCLLCTRGKEEYVVRKIRQRGQAQALFPQRMKTFWQGRVCVNKPVPLLPGYVFVYGTEEMRRDEIQSIDHVLRVLIYDDTKEDLLKGSDLAFADWLWKFDGQIGALKALQCGDRIEIVDGLFKTLRGTVIRMDRRRRAVQVALDTRGVIQQLWLAYEVVECIGEERSLPESAGR